MEFSYFLSFHFFSPREGAVSEASQSLCLNEQYLRPSKTSLAKDPFFFFPWRRIQHYHCDSALLVWVCANCEGESSLREPFRFPLVPVIWTHLRFWGSKFDDLAGKDKSIFKGMIRIVFLWRESYIGKTEVIFKSVDYGRLKYIIHFELKESREMRIISPFYVQTLKWRNVELKANSITCFNQKESSKKQSIKEQSDSLRHQCMKIC